MGDRFNHGSLHGRKGQGVEKSLLKFENDDVVCSCSQVENQVVFARVLGARIDVSYRHLMCRNKYAGHDERKANIFL